MNEEQKNPEKANATADTIHSQTEKADKDNYYEVDNPKKEVISTIGDGEMHDEGTVGAGDMPDENPLLVETEKR